MADRGALDQLARQLCWRIYEITISTASIVEAFERKHALFEHRSLSNLSGFFPVRGEKTITKPR